MIGVKIKAKSGVTIPKYETKGSAGMDIRAYLEEPILLEPGERALIPTGLCIELPEGFEAQIRARSGLAINNGIGLVNGIGTIDSDYRGEIMIPLINWGKANFVINNNDRVAQMVICRYEKVIVNIVESLDDTQRGKGGFGHTGV